MTDVAMQRRLEAETRRAAITDCPLCDDEGWISGRHRLPSGTLGSAAWRCDHTNRPLPTGFIPDRI